MLSALLTSEGQATISKEIRELLGLQLGDRNLSFQQNLPQFNIAVLILQAASNRLADLKPLAPEILSLLPATAKGQATVVSL